MKCGCFTNTVVFRTLVHKRSIQTLYVLFHLATPSPLHGPRGVCYGRDSTLSTTGEGEPFRFVRFTDFFLDGELRNDEMCGFLIRAPWTESSVFTRFEALYVETDLKNVFFVKNCP